MGCKQCCQPLNTAANWVMAGVEQKCWPFSHITGVSITPVTGSQCCPDGSRKFIFFPNHGHRLAHPSCCSGAKDNKPPKNGYGGKFSLIRGGAYKNKGDGEREREKIVFHFVTEVSKLDLCPCLEPRRWLLSARTRIYRGGAAGSEPKFIAYSNAKLLLVLSDLLCILLYCNSLYKISPSL